MNRSCGGLIALWKEAVEPSRRGATLILASSTLLMVTWKYFGATSYYRETVHEVFPVPGLAGDPAAAAAVYHFLAAVVLLGVIPALLVRFVLGQRLSDFGVSLGILTRTVRTAVIWGPIFIAIGYFSAGDELLRQEYPIHRELASAGPSKVILHVITYLGYYIAWEFHFRGFLLFGLRDQFGDSGAVLVQTLASTLLHIGKPAAETFGAIGGGLLWGWIALRTRSILSTFLQHSALGLALDYFICHRQFD